ncbi:hypothetical protein D3C78_1241430 [compost metagenome]
MNSSTSSPSGAGSGGASTLRGLARWISRRSSLARCWLSTATRPPSAATITSSSALAVSVREKPAGVSPSHRRAASGSWRQSMSRLARPRRVCSDSALPSASSSAIKRAPGQAVRPRALGAAWPPAAKASSSALWRPSRSITSSWSPASRATTVSPPGATRWRSSAGARANSAGSRGREITGMCMQGSCAEGAVGGGDTLGVVGGRPDLGAKLSGSWRACGPHRREGAPPTGQPTTLSCFSASSAR